MEQLSFEEDEKFERRDHLSFRRPGLAQWVVTHSGGLVKDEKQANYILLGFVCFTIFLSLFLLFGNNASVGNSGDIRVLPAM